MGIKNFCDVCEKEVEKLDLRLLQAEEMDTERVSIPKTEICVWCMNKVKSFIETLKPQPNEGEK